MSDLLRLPTVLEQEALRAIAEFGTIRAAAAHLGVSPHTVDGQLDKLRRKTGLRYLPQLVAWGAKQGWLDSQSSEPLPSTLPRPGRGRPRNSLAG